ncbi:MAG: sensor histidine kinase, partial [Anaerolineae bacterium]|nr:sensor histidine kinase [Anaerolineae bacterium]
YSPVGSTIQVNVTEHENCSDRRKYAKVSVFNSGSFIPPEEQEKIFDKYYRRNHHHQPGQGLGLYLVWNFVHMQGGQIHVDSHPTDGTIFWFTLPLVKS